MYGLQKYITQSDDLIRLWYSEPLYETSIAVGATQVCSMNYGSFGAKYILISCIIISSGLVAGAANLVTFKDKFNRTLFVMDASREGNGSIPIVQVIPGESFKITATFQTEIDNYFFTVQHQYLREVDKTITAKF